jgi:CHAT domain-containing protein/Flp pilus assembly protein TadD
MKILKLSIFPNSMRILSEMDFSRFLFLSVLSYLIVWQSFAQNLNQAPLKKAPLQDSVEKYQNRKEFEKVLPFAEQWVEKLKQAKMEASPEYGFAHHVWGTALSQIGKGKEAEPVLLKGLDIRKRTLGENHPDVASSLDNLGNLYSDLGNYPKAEPYYLQAMEIRKKAFGEYHPEVASSQNNLGNLYINLGNYPKAEPYYIQSLEIQKKALGENHLGVAILAHNLGSLYLYMGNYPKAESSFLKALEIRKKSAEENYPELAQILNNLGILYQIIGNDPKAEDYYLQSIEIDKKALGENHPEVAGTLNNLGNLYMYLSNYQKAESCFLKVLEISKKAGRENHPDVAQTIDNLGGLYKDLGNYPKAEDYLLHALEIRKKALGENHPDFATSMHNMGYLHEIMGNFPKSESYYLQALEIRKKALGENHPEVAQTLNNLGIIYLYMGNYLKAESCSIQAWEIWKKALGENHEKVAHAINNLGVLYGNMGNYTKAEPYHLKALEIRKIAFRETHPDLAFSISNLGNLHFAKGQMNKAEAYYLDLNAMKLIEIHRYFPFLSDHEKLLFYENKLANYHEVFKSFCISRFDTKRAIASELYNDQLVSKGLLLNSSAKWKHRIKTSGDKKLFNLYNDWEAIQARLNKLLQSTDSTERAGIDSVQAKTEKMEKELSLRSENFAKLADKKLINWKDVQKALKPGEAAIEMIRVKKPGIEKTVTDTSDPKKPVYKVKGLTDTIYYAALIVKPGSVYPEMVLLKNGNELEDKALKFYQNSISKQIPDNQSYGKFWSKIGTKLGTSTRVFFSPDGVFHNINLNTLYNPKTKKYLLEEKEVRMVTATKDLVNPNMAEEENKLAELVGFPNYYTAGSTAGVATTEWKSQETSFGFQLGSMGELVELPGTKVEVDRIADVLAAKGWEVKNYTQEKALEANIKESYKPRVLHIATHGFFQPDSTKGSNPLLRSGLMLAGAGSTLKGEKNEGEDGILTAYEAMNLNLDNTDLVVLSACETGLGEIKNGEGVYGLQRAFKVAGARSLIMSLWKVDDEATQELMVGFYRNWLGNAVGSTSGGQTANSKRSAFLKAQKELKAKYPNPYYWGAFVMVGE